jgi:hypothetical protein
MAASQVEMINTDTKLLSSTTAFAWIPKILINYRDSSSCNIMDKPCVTAAAGGEGETKQKQHPGDRSLESSAGENQ